MLQLSDRKELIDTLNVRANGKILKKADTLNAALSEKGFLFKIIEFNTSKVINGKKKNYKSAWKIERVR